jgi:hypothetical protein
VEPAMVVVLQCEASSTCCPCSAFVHSMCSHVAKELAAAPRTSTASVTMRSFISSYRKRRWRRSMRG